MKSLIAVYCEKWRKANKDKVREYDRSESTRARKAKWARNRRKNNPELVKKLDRENRNTIHQNAMNKVSWAIESGKIKRLPCEVCGNKKTEAHHNDYSKPLQVKWLCKLCHELEHSKT